MAMLSQTQYKPKDFVLRGLNGLSDKQIEVHLGLYKGYVTNTNTLNERILDLMNQGKAGTPEYAEQTRRLGFEYNGMVLHEYYFGQLKGGGSQLAQGGGLGRALQQSFGSYDNWMKDFRAIGGMRGVGWAILFLVVSVVAALFGFTNVAVAAAGAARILFGIFLFIFLVLITLVLLGIGIATGPVP